MCDPAIIEVSCCAVFQKLAIICCVQVAVISAASKVTLPENAQKNLLMVSVRLHNAVLMQ